LKSGIYVGCESGAHGLHRDWGISTYKDASNFKLFRFATRRKSRKRSLWHSEIDHVRILP
jgi:hypothetical protein